MDKEVSMTIIVTLGVFGTCSVVASLIASVWGL